MFLVFLRSIGTNTHHVSYFFPIDTRTSILNSFFGHFGNLYLNIFLKQTLSLCLSHQIKHFKLKTCIKFYSTLIQRFVKKKNEIIITEAFTSLAVFKRDPVKNFKFVGLCKILVRTDDYCKENPKKMAKYWQIKRQAERYF